MEGKEREGIPLPRNPRSATVVTYSSSSAMPSLTILSLQSALLILKPLCQTVCQSGVSQLSRQAIT